MKQVIGSVEVDPHLPAPEGEGRARRYHLTSEGLETTPDPDISVLADVLARSVKLWPNKNAVGWRPTIRIVKETKEVIKIVGGEERKEEKVWSYFELGDYQWWTYAELGALVKQAGSSLVETGHSKDTIFSIYSATTPRWQLMANACASQSVTFVTAYDSLGEDGLRHSIIEPSVYGIFTNAALLGTVANVIDKTSSIKVLVYDGPADDIKKGALEKIKAAHDGSIKVFTLDEFLALGKDHVHEPNLPQPEDLATIMYTSGSTGDPKGVMLSNANIIATIAGLRIMLGDILEGDHFEHTYIAYLPLAHIFEYAVETSMFFLGIPMGYAGVKTLTDASVRNCRGDIRTLRPTIMVGVPAVWQLISKGIQAQVRNGGRIKSTLFHLAYVAKKWAGADSYIAQLLDAVVFKAVKQATGGRLVWGVSGGAPLSRETQEFLSMALVKVIQGWGMTESTALSAILHPDYFQLGAVGLPVPSCEIKLVDFAEAGYFSTNTPPQGEVWLRGHSISKGYYKRDDLTADAWTSDNWLKTGDIGQWNPDGTLSIIDRAKNLVKLGGGEYIAIEHLESIYRNCGVVSNLCVYADSNASKPMAIVFPHEANLKSLIASKGITVGPHADLKDLCENEAVKKAIFSELGVAAKNANLKPMETLQTIVLTPEEWTPANGFMTAAQKLQRKKIISTFKSEIDAVYP